MTKKVIRTQSDFDDPTDAALWREELNKYLSPEDWHEVGTTGEPVFQNSWVNYNTATHPSAGFYKHNGRVYLKGLISTGSIPSVAFTLPEGYRPNFSRDFAVASGGAFGYFYVDSNGDINIQVGNNFAFSLAGCSFRVD